LYCGFKGARSRQVLRADQAEAGPISKISDCSWRLQVYLRRLARWRDWPVGKSAVRYQPRQFWAIQKSILPRMMATLNMWRCAFKGDKFENYQKWRWGRDSDDENTDTIVQILAQNGAESKRRERVWLQLRSAGACGCDGEVRSPGCAGISA